METKNQTAQESAQSGVVDYAAVLRQYHRYGRGRSMKKFCDDEGYDYWKFCKLYYGTVSFIFSISCGEERPKTSTALSLVSLYHFSNGL